VNKDVFIIGSDRSTNLVKIASRHQPHSSIVADTLQLPHKPRSFDFAISIAVIHHLSTPARRIDAVRSILDVLKANGKSLIYVWALEQKGSRRGWDEGCEQDVLVPWVMKGQQKSQGSGVEDVEDTGSSAKAGDDGSRTFQRYYHLYRKGELEEDVVRAGGVVLEAGYERDNWWAIVAPKT